MKKPILFILFLFSLFAQAQENSFSAQVDTNKILIGEQITLSLNAKIPAQIEHTWPIFSDTLAGFELIDVSKLDTLKTGDYWTLKQELTVTSFDSGYSAIPPISIQFGGNTLQSEAIGIAIGFPEFDEEVELYDIKKPLEVPPNWWPVILIVGGGILLAVALFFIARSIKAKKLPEMKAPKIVLAPHIEAMQRLQKLENDGLWQKGEIKAYYSQLTDILRMYMERQFNVQAMESTAEEVIELLERQVLPSSHLAELRPMLRTSDLVKFAKVKPLSEENHRALALVRQFVDITKPQQETKAEENVEGSV
jgi:hypothetical protein